MTFTFNGKQYKILFEYKPVDGHRGVMCYIIPAFVDARATPLHLSSVGQGWSKCVPQDAFVKETGRKIALKRALRTTFMRLLKNDAGTYAYTWVTEAPEDFNRRAFRTAAWKAYHGRRNGHAKSA